jgi:hypothetical protein
VEAGEPAWRDPEAFDAAMAEPDVAAALRDALPGAFAAGVPSAGGARFLVAAERIHTVGRWGPPLPA